jgi:hypothetical protein
MIGGATNNLTKMWYRITNITCHASGSTGDVLAIKYVNSHATYGESPYELYAQDLDERYKVLHELLWTATNYVSPKDQAWVKGKYDGLFPHPNETWSGAVGDMSGATPFIFPYASERAGLFVYGSGTKGHVPNPDPPPDEIVEEAYFCEGIWASNQWKLVQLYSNLNPKTYVYAMYTTNTGYKWEFDLQGSTWGVMNQYTIKPLSYYYGETNITKTNWIGQTSTPLTLNPPSSPEPPMDSSDEKIKGYTINKTLLILKKWTDGQDEKEFVYK